MHITNQKLGFDIFTVVNLQNIFMEYHLYFWHKIKTDNFDPYNLFLAIAVLLMTGFVFQGHIYD